MLDKHCIIIRLHCSTSCMRPVVTDGVAWCRSVGLSRAKTTERNEIPFGIWTRVDPRNHVLDEVQIPMREWAILMVKRGRQHTCPDMSDSRYTQRLSIGHIRYSADANWGVLDGVHNGATWRIRLNCPCAAAMWPCQITLTTCCCCYCCCCSCRLHLCHQ